MQEFEMLITLINYINDILPANQRGKTVHFRLNTEKNNPSWKETISIRCGKLNDELVGPILAEVFEAAKPRPPLVDRVGINLSTVFDKSTQERSIVEGQRTIYFTLRPMREVFEIISKRVGEQEDYEPIITLANVLYEYKFNHKE